MFHSGACFPGENTNNKTPKSEGWGLNVEHSDKNLIDIEGGLGRSSHYFTCQALEVWVTPDPLGYILAGALHF